GSSPSLTGRGCRPTRARGRCSVRTRSRPCSTSATWIEWRQVSNLPGKNRQVGNLPPQETTGRQPGGGGEPGPVPPRPPGPGGHVVPADKISSEEVSDMARVSGRKRAMAALLAAFALVAFLAQGPTPETS